MQPLRIGITCYATFGGSGVIATELGMALAERGHEVHFITSRVPVRLQSYPLTDVSFHEVNTYNYALFEHRPYDLALAAKMAEVAENYELDLLHVHYAIPHAISAHLAQEMLDNKIKVVTTLHGTDITLVGNDPSLYKITKFAIDQSDAVTSVSNWLRDETVREFAPQKEVQVIRNFVNTSQFRPDLDGKWAGRHYCDENIPRLIHVSNFRPVKRAPDAVEVFAQVLEYHDCQLLMVGDGPDLDRAVQRAKKLGVWGKVHFLGNREDVSNLLSASDIALIPSENESFGLSALEAMACGCAVVGSRVGGLPEVVNDGESGYLCEIGDVDAMAGRVRQLFENSEALSRLKAQARKCAVEKFDISVVLPEYENAYYRVLERSPETSEIAEAVAIP